MNQAPTINPIDIDQATVLHREPTGQVRLVEFEKRPFEVMAAHFEERFRRYRKDWARTSEFSWLPDFPLSLDFEVNASCNLRCVMCVMGSKGYVNPMAGEPMMDMGSYRRIMAEAETMGLPAVTFGFLSEPLLRSDLPEMIRLAREAGVMDIRLGTNGALMTREVSSRLIEAGLTRLEVSLDAFRPETFGRIRRGARLDRIVRNVQDFLELRSRADSDFPILRLSFLRLPLNEHELDEFLFFWRDKADMFSIQEPIYFEEAPISKEMVFTQTPVRPGFRCAQPWQRVIIRSNGDVFPCCSLYGLGMRMGSIKESPIASLWRDALIDDLRRLHQEGRYQDNPDCFRCASRSALRAEPKQTLRKGGKDK